MKKTRFSIYRFKKKSVVYSLIRKVFILLLQVYCK